MFSGKNAIYSCALAGGVALHVLNIYIATTIMPSAVKDIGGLDYYALTTTLFVAVSVLAATAVEAAAAPRWRTRRLRQRRSAFFDRLARRGVDTVWAARIRGWSGVTLLARVHDTISARRVAGRSYRAPLRAAAILAAEPRAAGSAGPDHTSPRQRRAQGLAIARRNSGGRSLEPPRGRPSPLIDGTKRLGLP